MRVDYIEARSEMRDSIDQNLINFVNSSGYETVLIPNQFREETNKSKYKTNQLDLYLNSLGINGIVLSGGNNIGQFPKRDKTEYTLINYALERQIPLLGICRGMQILAGWSGVGLKPIEGHVGKRLQLTGEISQNVNSFHEFVISNCPKDFSILARCTKGTIQAISHQNLPWEGWMWHPEREEPFKQYDLDRFKKLFN